jgi:hypothetical protein
MVFFKGDSVEGFFLQILPMHKISSLSNLLVKRFRNLTLEFSAIVNRAEIVQADAKTAHSGNNIASNITHLKAFWWHGMRINEEREWGGN